MKRFFVLASFVFATLSLSAQGILEFSTTTIVADTIVTGDTAQKVFHFTNTGDKPLTIRNVTALNAGCKVKFTKGAIQPGGQGKVTVDFSEVSSTKGQKKISFKVYSTAKNKAVALHIESFFKAANPTY
ncbi:MAG: DUF1573 domain-containing protein [Salibacteraceae bacterium]